jgi:DNA polymerase-3 subunit epsilon
LENTMLIAILDCETTGLDPETDAVIEVAAILYDTQHRAILQQVSTLLLVEANPAGEINGIPPELSRMVADDLANAALEVVFEMACKSAYLVAFNSDFDQQFCDKENLFGGLPKPWADAAAITYPRMGHKRDLVNIALANGVPVVNAHRALDDCRILAELLSKVLDLDYQLERAARPKVLVKAVAPFSENDMVKAAGFKWNRPDLIPRAWAKRMPREDAEALPFAVEVPG